MDALPWLNPGCGRPSTTWPSPHPVRAGTAVADVATSWRTSPPHGTRPSRSSWHPTFSLDATHKRYPVSRLRSRSAQLLRSALRRQAVLTASEALKNLGLARVVKGMGLPRFHDKGFPNGELLHRALNGAQSPPAARYECAHRGPDRPFSQGENDLTALSYELSFGHR